MPSNEIRSWTQLESFLKTLIEDCLSKEMAQHVKEEIMTAISTEVYGAGIPVKYIRRGGNIYGGMGNPLGTGSLADPNEMVAEVKDCELTVTDQAKRNMSYDSPGVGYDESKSLAENIIFGYGNRGKWYNRPRPFIDRTIDNIKSSNSHIDVMKDALRDRGLTVL